MIPFHIVSDDKKTEFQIDTENKLVRYRSYDEDENGYKLKIECEAPIPFLQNQKVDQWNAISNELGMDGNGPITVENSSKVNSINKRIAGLVEIRLAQALKYSRGMFRNIGFWVADSREVSNFTFDIRATSYTHFRHAIALVTDEPPEKIGRYIDELRTDAALVAHFRSKVAEGPYAHVSDATPKFARRLMWYALVRANKPKLVVETGVDKGLGAVLLCAALKRNHEEGHSGRYLGTDYNPHAGQYFDQPYSDFGEILYGDSIESLRKIDQPIDLFVNDSDHSAEYEGREYDLIEKKLSKTAVIVGDNAHVTDKLADFSERTGRKFMFCPEMTVNTWYNAGTGAGLSFT